MMTMPPRDSTPFANLLTAVAVAAAGATLWAALSTTAGRSAGPSASGPPPTAVPPRIPLEIAEIIGSRSANVAVVEFGNFLCEYCRAFARGAFPALKEKFVKTDRVMFGFVQVLGAPATPLATSVAEAAECAGRQGRFWEFHDALFSEPVARDAVVIRQAAAASGLGFADFDSCVSARSRSRIAAQTSLGYELGIQATPTFIIGRVIDGAIVPDSRYSGMDAGSRIEATIERLLAEAPSADRAAR